MKKETVSKFSTFLLEHIGKQISDLRKRKKITQATLCNLLNIGQDTLSSYESGKTAMPIDKFFLIVTILKVNAITLNLHAPRLFAGETQISIEDDVEQYCGEYLSRLPNTLRSQAIYRIVEKLKSQDSDAVGQMILTLYLEYCETLKDEDGKRICEKTKLVIDPTIKESDIEKLLNPPKPPPIDYGDSTVDVEFR